VIEISFGCTRDFRVKMRGTSSPEDKLAGDLGNVIGPHRPAVVGRIFYGRKISTGQFGTFATISATSRHLRFYPITLSPCERCLLFKEMQVALSYMEGGL
jgi:hypothetical protein